MTLALLLTAVGGAWAQDPNAVTAAEINADLYSGWSSDDEKLFKASELPGFQAVTEDQAKSWTGAPSTGKVKLFYEFVADGHVKVVIFNDGKYDSSYEETEFRRYFIYEDINYMGETRFFYTTGPAPEPAIDVKWDAATKTGNFTMPAFDVELTPIYAPTAMFATDGNLVLTPTAIEGIYAESTDAIVKAGTVAKIGETENPQGIVMYAVTSANQATAPELSAFSADVPTAKDITAAGDVLVWYYIKGADTPQGQTATAENTFNDSEICATPIKVTVLSNKFDITFKAANDNTIEAGKATVTVGGTAATVTEGKLEGVKMGTEVKVKAKDGYKFRKVEVKKKAAAPSLNITNPSVGQVIGSDGKNYVSGTLPTGVTAVAKICYVSGSNGLALALTDEEGQMDWSTAQTVCAAHTPAFTGGTWKLATKDEWNSMISAAGSDADLRDGFGFVGGTNMQSSVYWSSTEIGSNKAWFYSFDLNSWYNSGKGSSRNVRACLAF